jgi:hypothetical protein
MAPHDDILTSIFQLIKELTILVVALEERVHELEQINKDKIDEIKIQQFYEDKLGL